MDWPMQSANKQKCTYSYRYIQQFHILSITATTCLMLPVFKTVTSHVKQHNRILLSLVLWQQFWTGDIHITTGCTWAPYKYTLHVILCFVTQLIFLTSQMLINLSFRLIKFSFTKSFLNYYRQFIKTRYKELNERESFSAQFEVLLHHGCWFKS